MGGRPASRPNDERGQKQWRGGEGNRCSRPRKKERQKKRCVIVIKMSRSLAFGQGSVCPGSSFSPPAAAAFALSFRALTQSDGEFSVCRSRALRQTYSWINAKGLKGFVGC